MSRITASTQLLVLLLFLFLLGGVVGLTEDERVNIALTNAGGNLPVLNCSFTQPAINTIGVRPAYGYIPDSDPNDSPSVSAYHTGLAVLNGVGNSSPSGNGYVDLHALTGAQSCGATMPVVGGPGYYPYDSIQSGWSFEIVIKFPSYPAGTGWSKIFCLGNGAPVDDFVFGWYGDDKNNGLYKLVIYQYNNKSVFPVTQHGVVEAYKQPALNTWYHIVIGMQATNSTPVGPGGANWYFWVNGRQLNYADGLVSGSILTAIQGANYPLPVARGCSYIGRSCWSADLLLNATVDAFRVYDYLLTTSQVQAVAAVYNLNTNAPYPPTSLTVPTNTTETNRLNSLLSDLGLDPPLFNADFSTNPQTITNWSTTSYTWQPADNSSMCNNAACHTGLLVLNGGFVDLATTSGPTSIGLTMPVIGGVNTAVNESLQGYSFELVVKPTAATTWSKFFDLGNGPNRDNILLGWYASTGKWDVEMYNFVYAGGTGAITYAGTAVEPVTTLVLNQWSEAE